MPEGRVYRAWRRFWLVLGYRECIIHGWVWTGRKSRCPFYHGATNAELPKR